MVKTTVRGALHPVWIAIVFQSCLPLFAPGAAGAGDVDVLGLKAPNAFVGIDKGRAVIHCGELDLTLDPAKGFAPTATASSLPSGGLVLRSTAIRIVFRGQEVPVSSRANLADLSILEEGPQRIAVRAPFAVFDSASRPIANGQYEIYCYPEGEAYITVSVLQPPQTPIQAVVDVRLAEGGAFQYGRAYEMPLVIGRNEADQAVGVFWHSGDAPKLGVGGGELQCLFDCYPRPAGGAVVLARSFVLSVAPTSDEMRRRCLAHIHPLRARRMDGCRPQADASETSGPATDGSYSFREGAYRFLAESPAPAVELDNADIDARRVRVRFASRGPAPLDLAAEAAWPRGELQAGLETINAGQPSAAFAPVSLGSFEVAGADAMTVRGKAPKGILMQWVGARMEADGVERVYQLVSDEPPRAVAAIRFGENPRKVSVDITSVTAPASALASPVAAISLVPLSSDALGKFTQLTEVAIARNQPGRVVLHARARSPKDGLTCDSDVVFRMEGTALAISGYHTLESPPGRAMPTGALELPSIRLGDGPRVTRSWPRQFFFADKDNQVGVCARSGARGFGYALHDLKSIHPRYILCGFFDNAAWGLAFLGRPLMFDGSLITDAGQPRLAMRLETPRSRGRQLQACWKLLAPAGGDLDRKALDAALQKLRRAPVDARWLDRQLALDDGQVAHRVFDLGPSANPGAADGYSYLIDGGRELAIVGAGSDDLREPWLFRVRALGFDPALVRKILLCNAAADHAGGARVLKDLTKATTYLDQSASRTLSLAGPQLDQRNHAAWITPVAPPESPPPVDRPLQDNMQLRVGDVVVRYIHSPGPCEENGAFIVNAGGQTVAFTGDLLAAGNEDGRSGPGAADAHRHGNISEWLLSLRKFRVEQVDMAAPSQAPLLADMRAVDAACSRAISRCANVAEIEGLEYFLPRSMGMLFDPSTSTPITGAELAGVKQLGGSVFWSKEAYKIADGLWRVGGEFENEPEDANVFLVDGGTECALIGAGSGFHTPAILNRIQALGKKPTDVKYILLPSSHWCEARGASSLRAATQARVLAHPFETRPIRAGDVLRTGLVLDGFSFGGFPPSPIDRELVWGETLKVGGQSIHVIDAPGFHRGSTAFLLPFGDQRYLASGQTALGTLPTPDGRTVYGAVGWLDPHWGGCVPTLRRTLERFVALKPDTLLPGQGAVQKEEAVAKLEDCLNRLDEFQKIEGVKALFPAELLEPVMEPARPDLRRLAPK
jgi:glyoxylase-like metal-dependent hydrolase (beta-lactamase superfamily II)